MTGVAAVALPLLLTSAMLAHAPRMQCNAETIRGACERSKALGEFRGVDWSVDQCAKDGANWCKALVVETAPVNPIEAQAPCGPYMAAQTCLHEIERVAKDRIATRFPSGATSDQIIVGLGEAIGKTGQRSIMRILNLSSQIIRPRLLCNPRPARSRRNMTQYVKTASPSNSTAPARRVNSIGEQSKIVKPNGAFLKNEPHERDPS
jgi:hypothetical protein